MKKSNYDGAYNEAFNKEYDHLIKNLRSVLNKKDGLRKEKKLLDFRENLLNEFELLTKKDFYIGAFKEDKYILELIKIFSQRESVYEDFPIENFFKNDFYKIKDRFRLKPTDIVYHMIYNMLQLDTLKYLAKYFASSKFLIVTRDLNPTKDSDTETVIKIILDRSLKKVDPAELVPSFDEINTFEETSTAINENNKNKNVDKEPTLARQVLLMYYLLDELGLNTEPRSLSARARIIQFLTGKNIDKIKDVLANPLEFKNLKGQIGDLELIRGLISDLKHENILIGINKDLHSATLKKQNNDKNI